VLIASAAETMGSMSCMETSQRGWGWEILRRGWRAAEAVSRVWPRRYRTPSWP